jgi:hypothetical protein
LILDDHGRGIILGYHRLIIAGGVLPLPPKTDERLPLALLSHRQAAIASDCC